MLRIESLEIDDHILEKIESKHGIFLPESRKLAFQTRGMLEEAEKGCIKSSARPEPDATSWWYW
ncbi:MAG: hypothetical protein HY530_06435 [Chloroflexi bacterium]|nr:hypothetical protein [Chloroflexota bacterium]